MKPAMRLIAPAILAAFAGAVCLEPAPARAADVLPKAAAPAQATAWLSAPPAGLEIVDIRPAAEYADYALPGSINLDPAAVLADETLLAGNGPLVIVDKDGTAAFAVAGMLSRKATRPVMALTGGLAALWAEREVNMAVKEVPLEAAPSPAMTPASPGAPSTTPAPGQPGTPAQPGTPSPAPAAPANKNAGC